MATVLDTARGGNVIPLVEAAPARLALGGGAWIRFRRISAEKVVVTGEGGRFVLLDAAEIDALSAGDPEGERRSKLAGMGFVLPDDGEGGGRLSISEDSALHVLRLRGRNEAGGEIAMDREVACAVVDRVLEGSSGFVRLELCDADPLDEGVVRALVTHARAWSAVEGRGLSIGLRTSLDGVTPELARTLAEGRVALKGLFAGPPGALETERIRVVHEAFSSIGVAPAAAFVVGEVPLTREAVLAGPEALVAACRASGLVFVELSLAASGLAEGAVSGVTEEEHRDFYGAVVRRILDVQSTGTLLVEMGLALHLETLVLRADPRRAKPPPEPVTTIWTPDGKGTTRGQPVTTSQAVPSANAGVGFGAGCGGCAYDPYCGTGILRDPAADLAERRWGTVQCRASMSMFDAVFELLASPDGPRVRRVLRVWMEAHDRVARRLGATG